jgi:hypothetical protein
LLLLLLLLQDALTPVLSVMLLDIVSALAPELRICLLQMLPSMALQIGERWRSLSCDAYVHVPVCLRMHSKQHVHRRPWTPAVL